MRLIHCADLHLDAKMNANLNKEQAKERKAEILHTFERMIAYAATNHIAAILIAGDLFDTKNISATARNTVLYNITNHPEITFYYLKGNHDNDNFLAGMEEIPENLKLFGSQWTTYLEANEKIAISGIELSPENTGTAYVSMMLDFNKFNIVMLHGQESEGSVKDKAEIINLKALRNKGIDYLALGHVHAYKKSSLDPRGTYCYAGCLEGRGFDECGEHGFVVLDVDETTGNYTQEFVPFAQRTLYTVNVDVTGCQTTAEMVSRATLELERVCQDRDSLIKIVLTGMLDVACEKDVDYLLSRLKSQFYFVKVYDETSLKIDVNDYLLDESLKGEYVRQVLSDESLSEDEKKIIIRYGLQAIAGEEVQ
jgi:DNA repair exonuclease SbcCD nuclease subunit